MKHNGFTLIEVLVTITIITILASIIIPLSQVSIKRSEEMELRQNLRMIRTAIDEYKRAWDEGKIKRSTGESGYPPTLKTLEDGVVNAQSPDGSRIRFIRKVPRDPFNGDSSAEPHETWGLRSYESGPDDPKEGADVFDVYSKSEEVAIDTTPYRDW